VRAGEQLLRRGFHASDRRDDPLARAKLDFFLDHLAPRRVLFVVLTPGIDVCRYRNTIRDPRERFDFDGYEASGRALVKSLEAR
jgi:hypothetical protein